MPTHNMGTHMIMVLVMVMVMVMVMAMVMLDHSENHGTALDIAGTNKADASSLISAIKAAIDIVKIEND